MAHRCVAFFCLFRIEIWSSNRALGALYILGAISGALLVQACDPMVYLGGASGAAYALLSAHGSDLIINWSEMEFNWVRAAIFRID